MSDTDNNESLPAGWYKNQYNVVRWWDGHEWTENIYDESRPHLNSWTPESEYYDSQAHDVEVVSVFQEYRASSIVLWNTLMMCAPWIVFSSFIETFSFGYITVALSAMLLPFVVLAVIAAQIFTAVRGFLKIRKHSLPGWYYIFPSLNISSLVAAGAIYVVVSVLASYAFL